MLSSYLVLSSLGSVNSQIFLDMVVSLHYIILAEQVEPEKNSLLLLINIAIYIYAHIIRYVCVCVNICIGTHA